MRVSCASLCYTLAAWLMVPGLVLIAAGCLEQRRLYWIDEALLHDGRTVEVERTVSYQRRLGWSLGAQYELTATNPDTGQRVRWVGALGETPLVLDFRDRIAYLVLTVGQTLGKYGCPEIPFVFFGYDDRARRWVQVPVGGFPPALLKANLSMSPTTGWGTWERRTKEEIARVNKDHERTSEGIVSVAIPTDFASWRSRYKNSYRVEGHSDDGCRHLVVSNEDPAHPQSPNQPSQRVKLEILETRDYEPRLVLTRAEWSALTRDADKDARCGALVKQVSKYSDTPELRGWLLFVNDASGRKKARPTLLRLCDDHAMWFGDHLIERGRLVLSKFTTAGDFVYRLSFEKPTQPGDYVGGFLPPSFRAENGFLLFDWLIGEAEGDYYRVKRTMKCRVREPGTR